MSQQCNEGNQETTTTATVVQPVIPTGIRFHHNGRVVAKGILEYIDKIYSVVTLKTIKAELNDLPVPFRELKAGQQFSKVHEILEKLYPKTNKNPVTTWVARVSVKVGEEWKLIENGNRDKPSKNGVDLNESVAKKRRFSRKELAEHAVNKRKREEFYHMFRSDSSNSKNVSRVSDENSDSDIEESNTTGASSTCPVEITEDVSDDPVNPRLPSTIPIPTGIRFLKDRSMVAQGELLFVDSQYSVVHLDNVVDRKDIVPQVKKLKGVTFSRIGLFLDLLYPKKGKASNRWAGRVEIMVRGKWEIFKYKDPSQTTECLTREYLISHCVNRNKREQFNHLTMDILPKKRNREDDDDDDDDENDSDNTTFIKPTSKKSRLTETPHSPSTTERTNSTTIESSEQESSLQTPVSRSLSDADPLADHIRLVLDKLIQIDDEIKRKRDAIIQLQEEMKKLEEEKATFRRLFTPYL